MPAPGADVLAPKDAGSRESMAQERPVGRVTSVARHHEAGPIALALVKRKVDPEAQLVVRDQPPAEEGSEEVPEPVFYAAGQELIVRPDAGQAVGRPQETSCAAAPADSAAESAAEEDLGLFVSRERHLFEPVERLLQVHLQDLCASQ